jgi:hypothetical protein
MRYWIGSLGLLIGLSACQHTRTTGDEGSSPGAKGPQRAPAASATSGLTSRPGMPDKQGRISSPGHPTLSLSPEGLRTPEGTAKLKQALGRAGLLRDAPNASEEELRQAIIAFQASKDLAKTGFADHETLRELGLDPAEIDVSQMPRHPGAP